MSQWADYKRIVDGLSTAVLILDRQLLVQYLNPACEALFGVSIRRVKGQKLNNIFAIEENYTKAMLQVFETNNPFINREALLQPINTLPVRADYYVSTIQEDTQQPKLLIEFRELDRLLRISRDDALLHHQQTNRQLIRGIAHEVKNPLGGIRGAAQLLERSHPSEEVREYTTVIIQETDRLTNLVDQMLGPNSCQDFEPVNIHEVLERVRSLVIASATTEVQIIRDYDTSLPEINGIKDQLIQCVLNIAQNAYQALAEQEHNENREIIFKTRVARQFTIGGKRHRIAMCVQIIDNGPGIKAELLEGIFYPMISGRAMGNGLGLSISQSIINQHQGLIECDSEPGCTTFSIILPME